MFCQQIQSDSGWSRGSPGWLISSGSPLVQRSPRSGFLWHVPRYLLMAIIKPATGGLSAP